MALSQYDVTISIFISSLKQTSHFLQKTKSWAEENGIPLSKFVEGRLAPDMHPLPFQIQEMTNIPRDLAVDLWKTEHVPFERNETTFEELQTTVAKTIEVLQKVPSNSMDGKLDAVVQLRVDGGEYDLTRRKYVLKYAIPDFFFHVTTAYGILRHLGAPVGKFDYLGDILNS